MAKQINAREVSKLIARLPSQSKRLGRLEALVPKAQARLNHWQWWAIGATLAAGLGWYLYWRERQEKLHPREQHPRAF